MFLAKELTVKGDKGASEIVAVHERLDDGLEGGAEGSGEEESRGLFEFDVAFMASFVSCLGGSGEGEGRDVDVKALGDVLKLGESVGGCNERPSVGLRYGLVYVITEGAHEL